MSFRLGLRACKALACSCPWNGVGESGVGLCLQRSASFPSSFLLDRWGRAGGRWVATGVSADFACSMFSTPLDRNYGQEEGRSYQSLPRDTCVRDVNF